MTAGDLSDAGIAAAMGAGPAELWRRLFAAADALRTGAHASWCQPSSPEGVLVFPHPVYSDRAEEIQRLLCDLHVIVSFDWPAWDGPARYPRGEGLASASDADADAGRLATVIVRGERSCDGTLAVAISDGTPNAILARLRHWFEAELPAAASPSPAGVSAPAAGYDADLNAVTALLETLAADPLFAASQASKELFHSNMLAWYLKRWPQARGGLARAWEFPLDPAEQVTVRRDWRHLDLVLEVAGQPVLIVENKVFSLPDEDQLLRYGAIAGSLPGTPSLVLLSLADPDWRTETWASPGGGTWTYRSYASLAAALRPAAASISRANGFAGELLDRWMNLLDRLGRLAVAVGHPAQDAPLVLAKPVRAALARARLDAPVQKMRCQHLAAKLRQTLAEDGAGRAVRVRADLTNGAGLVEGFAGDDPAFGRQLQGEDFRLAIKVGKQAAGRGEDTRAAAEEQHASYFDFTYLRQLVPAAGPERPLPGSAARFLGFAPDFAYRYVKVPAITASSQPVRLRFSERITPDTRPDTQSMSSCRYRRSHDPQLRSDDRLTPTSAPLLRPCRAGLGPSCDLGFYGAGGPIPHVLLGPAKRRRACLAVVIQVAPRVGSGKYRVRICSDDHKQAQEGLNQALAARTAYRQIGGMTALSAPPPTRELLGRTPSGLRSHLIRGAKNRCGNPR